MKLHDVEKQVKSFTLLQKILITIICILVFFGFTTLLTGSSSIRSAGYDTFSMLRYSLIEHPVETVKNWQKDLASLRVVQKENEELKQIIASQKQYKAELLEKERYIKELEALLKFDSNATYTKIYADVIYRDINAWNNVIHVNKGSEDGITTDMAVVSSKGLIGRVYEVSKHSAKVKLLSSEKENVSVAINVKLNKNEVTPGILENYNPDNKTYNVRIFDANAKIKEGMQIITNGSGGVFPVGILVGEVKTIVELYNSKGLMLEVTPSVDFNDFNALYIVKVD